MILKELSREDCEQVRKWRNECLETLRTPYMLTKEIQSDFYDNVVCNRNSCHRYWGLHENQEGIETKVAIFCGTKSLVGAGGITNIEYENSIGEISLIMRPEMRDRGYGSSAVDLLLDKAFNYMGLKTVFGECYYCNDAHLFWRNTLNRYGTYFADLPDRKLWKGKHYGSVYFSVNGDAFNRIKSEDLKRGDDED